MSETNATSPADELRRTVESIQGVTAAAVEHLPGFQSGGIAPLIADLLTVIADDMDDEHAAVVEHPEWIGLPEGERWGVHEHWGTRLAESDNTVWKSALLLARFFNGDQS